MSYKVENLVKNKFQLGEGPHWDEKKQRLYFVDILKADIHRWDNSTSTLLDPLHLDDRFAAVVVPRDKGGLIIAADHRFATLDESTGKTETIVEAEADNDLSRFNDGKCDPEGRLWAGSMGVEKRPAEPELKQGTLYTLNKDRSVDVKLTGLDISNGLGWSPDNSVMYFIDSLLYNIRAFAYESGTGAISNPRVVVEFDKDMTAKGYEGIPDGLCMDCDGNIWVAMFFGGQVIKIDTKTGQKVEHIKISKTAIKTTSCCFGGTNMDELFVTSSLNGENEAARGFEVGDSGSLFKVTGLGVKGPPGVPYKG